MVKDLSRDLTGECSGVTAERAGEPAADSQADRISRLFSEHNESLIRFLATRLRSVQEAKEVAQEAYVRLLSLEDSGAVSFLRAFLFKTAANLATDRLRQRNLWRQTVDRGLHDQLHETPTPDHLAATAQEVEIIRRLIGELPPKCRRAFLLHRVRGMELAEIAKQMELSERMIRHYVLRAVLHCRAGLDAAQTCKESSHG
jgi:RNA polymerase sigma factor (sigma-70 family)